MIYESMPTSWAQYRDLKPVAQRNQLHELDTPNLLDEPPDLQLPEQDLADLLAARAVEQGMANAAAGADGT